MALANYEAKLADSDPISISYDFGDSLEGAIELFGEEAVFSRFKSASVVDLQALVRSKIKKALDANEVPDEEAIQEAISEWKPGTARRRGKSAQEKAKDLLSSLSPKDRAALIADLED